MSIDNRPTPSCVTEIREYNKWRRGEIDIFEVSPTKIGQSLDDICNYVEALERRIDALREALESLMSAEKSSRDNFDSRAIERIEQALEKAQAAIRADDEARKGT